MKIGFRVDANHDIGFGHIKRCLVLANQIRGIGDVVFFSKYKEAIDIIESEQFKVIEITDELVNFKNSKIDKLFIDLKWKIDESYINSIKDLGIKTILYDNDGLGIKVADVVILPIVYENKELFNLVEGELFYGFEYAIIDKKFFGERQKVKKKTILITMGGSDINDMTGKIVDMLKLLKEDFICNIVIGPGFKNQNFIIDDERFVVMKNVNNMAELMLKSDLGIILYGVTAYEAVAARLPTIMISDSHNLIEMKKFCKVMGITDLGLSIDLDHKKLNKNVLQLFNNKNLNLTKYLNNNKIIKAINGV